MFLLLAEKKLDSISQIKNLLDENRIECQVVNCSSSKVLLDLTKKLSPEVVMLDIEFTLDHDDISPDIVGELRKLKPDAYIISLIDADNYQKLDRVLEQDIDDYIFKPLQSEDAMLRINIGLQRKSQKTEVQNDMAEIEVQEVQTQSKDIFVEIADAFSDEPVIIETDLPQPTEVDEAKPAAINDHKELYPELSEDTLEEDQLFEPEETPDRYEEDKPYQSITDDLDDELPKGTFDANYNAAQSVDADPMAFDDQADDEESLGTFLDAFEKKQTDQPPQEQLDDQIPPAADAEGYIEDIDYGDESAPSDEVLEYYKGQLDTQNTDAAVEDLPAKEADLQASEHELTASELENKVNLQEEQLMQIDDSELFGTEYRKKPVDTKFFEELFDKDIDGGKKKRGFSVDRKTEKTLSEEDNLPVFDKMTYESAVSEKDTASLFDNLAQENALKEIDETPLFDQPAHDNAIMDKDQPLLFENAESNEARPAQKKPDKKKRGKTKPERPVSMEDVFLRDEDKLVESPAPKKRKSKDQGSKSKGNWFFKFTGNLIMVILLVILFTLSFFLIQSRISGDSPEIAGYKIFYVLSGSMSPAFDTGSVIFVEPMAPLAIAEGDIITFSSQGDTESLTTHRVVGINRESGLSFITRGDANSNNDPNPVQPEQLIGLVRGSVPYVGYLLSFVQTSQGLILLIFVPGLLILLFELRKIFGYMSEAKTEKNMPKKNRKKEKEFDTGGFNKGRALAGEDEII